MLSPADTPEDIEQMLMYLGLHTRTFGCPDPMFFDDAIPSSNELFDLMYSNVGLKPREVTAAASKLKKIEGVFMFPAERGDGYTLVGCRPMSYHARQRLVANADNFFKPPLGMVARKDIRSLVTPFTPILQVRRVEIDVDGRGTASPPGYLIKSERLGDAWQTLFAPNATSGVSVAYTGFRIAVALSATLATTWSISLKFDPESPGLRFLTDPTGVREFFKLRDVPEGKSRRAALTNWVSDHWRQLRHNPDDEVYVRKHLRGAGTFSWRGLSGTIHIPDSALKEAEEAKVARKRMDPAAAIRRRQSRR